MRKTNQALGLIETRGLTPLVTALDGAIKAAQVTLEGRRPVGGGLVNATVTGDVGAVRAAMDTAQGIINQMGATGMTHVIPRPDEAIWAMLKNDGLTAPEPGETSPDGGGSADKNRTEPLATRPEAAVPTLAPQAEVPAERPKAEVPALRDEPEVPAVRAEAKVPAALSSPSPADNTGGSGDQKSGPAKKKPAAKSSKVRKPGGKK